MLSAEIRHAIDHLADLIRGDRLTVGAVVRAYDVLAEIAERVELLEGAVLPPALTIPEARLGASEETPEGVVRLDRWRMRARSGGAPLPQTPA
ncbi:hypothetical protein [Neomegalonema sp.]|uniref:hypothetical protein n=1 Tax=Neomegalonema sp. TaxID=2039713 RepID=UPI002615746C|nr:hypothetical protein [Neomegalonema sp.]MDD2870111.1 hypothetical protein [Neomegalonema sp.]